MYSNGTAQSHALTSLTFIVTFHKCGLPDWNYLTVADCLKPLPLPIIMAEMQAQIKAVTVMAKEMGLSDTEALQFAKDTDKELRLEERKAEKE